MEIFFIMVKLKKLVKPTTLTGGEYIIHLPNAERCFGASQGFSYEVCELLARKHLLAIERDGRVYLTADNFVSGYAEVKDASFNARAIFNYAYTTNARTSYFVCTTCGILTEDARHNCNDLFCTTCGRKLVTNEEKSAERCGDCQRAIIRNFYSYHGYPLRSSLEFERPHLRDSYCHFGVEIEVDARDYFDERIVSELSDILNPNAFHPFAHFEHDSTINGCECITHPYTLKGLNNIRERLTKFYERAKELGGVFKTRNGLHIHFDRAYFGDDAGNRSKGAILISYLVYKYFDFFAGISHRERGAFNWTQKKDGCNTFIDTVVSCQYPDHRDAVNLSNAKTIEIRLFGGHISTADDLLAVVDIVNALARWAKEASIAQVEKATPAQIVRYINDCERVLAFVNATIPNAPNGDEVTKKEFVKALKKRLDA